jgi:hypothetical protein
VNGVYGLRIADQWFLQSYVFTRVRRSQSTLQRLLRGEIKKKTPEVIQLLLKAFTCVLDRF